MINKTKRQKPIDCDVHFKYLCLCGQFHWLSLNEASTKNFFIVCDCNAKIKIKTIDKIQVTYKKHKQKDKKKSNKDLKIDENITPEPINNTATNLDDKEPINIIPTQIQDTVITNISQSRSEIDIPKELLEACVNLLYTFGYNRKDGTKITKEFYLSYPVNEYKEFVNKLLLSIKG